MAMNKILTTSASALLSSAWNDTSNLFQERIHQMGATGIPSPIRSPTGALLPVAVPRWKIQDIIRLVILPILFAVGAPLNLAALSHLMAEKKTTSSLAARMHLLKLHLNISDLMILFVYTASQICWLITYEWRGGEFLCKFVKFSHTLSFGISSNVVVCIAFDRLASVFESKRRRSDERRKPGLRRVKISLVLAWTAAIACALPQFMVWTTYRPFATSSWTQCVSVFFVHEAALKRNPNLTLTAQNPLLISKTGYAAFHVLVIFWIPALIISAVYLHVMAWLCCHGRGNADRNPTTNEAGGLCRYWHGSFATVRSRLNSTSNGPNNVIDARYRSISKTRAGQVGVLVDEGACTNNKSCTLRGDYGALEPPDSGGYGGGVSLANPTSPKGSGCSSTPLLATAVGDHQPASGAGNSSPSIVVTPAVLDLQRVKRRAMRSSFLLVIAYIATWLPYNVIACWGLIDETHYKQYGVSVSFLQYLIVVNSVINPFLYGTVGRLKKYVTNS